jgi:ribosomal protein S14
MIKISKRVKKDLNRRLDYKRNSYQIIILKSLIKNNKLPLTLRHYARYKLSKKYKNLSISKMNRYCVRSNNFHSVYKQFKLSRRFLKEYASFGQIIGLSKK